MSKPPSLLTLCPKATARTSACNDRHPFNFIQILFL